ncbi:hypothetical protein DB44_CT00030 [Candidatus Protochlamydia amoebophila]|uniref:Uncharacterized protein n=1 Tax=Candidatus Protochlamydia amoebophila TaxID=362787 RepID=A0A0C1H326_9BACT|nr:hypothetical protein DB44_CT00030 [Candidatus Protochlamydia amoebophila]
MDRLIVLIQAEKSNEIYKLRIKFGKEEWLYKTGKAKFSLFKVWQTSGAKTMKLKLLTNKQRNLSEHFFWKGCLLVEFVEFLLQGCHGC